MLALGFMTETSKKKGGRIKRPVLFGENGTPRVAYEVDAFHNEHRIVVEVEAGRGAANNADYRDIVRSSLILDADYLVLLQPFSYRSSNLTIAAYAKTREQLDALYASDRLKLPFDGLLLIGY